MDDKQYVLLSDILADIEYQIQYLQSYLAENQDLDHDTQMYFLGKIAGYASMQFTLKKHFGA